MKYFVPSWHLDISDWASTQQIITFDDAIGNMRIMNHADEDYGLIIGDYKPQFDYAAKRGRCCNPLIRWRPRLDPGSALQDNSRIVDIQDFNWPKGTYFEYGPFSVDAICNDEHIARLLFNNIGQILRIERWQNGYHQEDIIMDTRGFVSSIQTF